MMGNIYPSLSGLVALYSISMSGKGKVHFLNMLTNSWTLYILYSYLITRVHDKGRDTKMQYLFNQVTISYNYLLASR